MKISVAIATFNEEKNLGDCLESVKDLADEIIIVDGGSVDKTIEIAKKYGAKVIITHNPPIFHINKQKAIDKCGGNWILQLDADERISLELAGEIKNKINSDNYKDVNGFWIPRKNWFLGRFLMKGGQYPDYTLRLYRKGKGGLPQMSVHEQATVEGKTDYLTNPLIHMSDLKFKRYLIRFNRYTNLIRDELIIQNPGPKTALKYMIFSPIGWFFLTYLRHKGFMDGWQGFVFSFFSSLRFPVSYIKYLRR
ncbi:MAG: glycosyltransferase family 2 protein [Cyanobacteria bacterium]|nr:glycosyltransferase family 2 protein [Cyanobacteriota bacterium]